MQIRIHTFSSRIMKSFPEKLIYYKLETNSLAKNGLHSGRKYNFFAIHYHGKLGNNNLVKSTVRN